MARIRDKGTGSFYQRASDGRWIGTLEAGWTAKGGRRRVYVTGKTATEVRDKLNVKRKQALLAGGQPSGASRMTVRSWAEQWLQQQEAVMRPNTRQSTGSVVRNWIIPVLGHKRLDQLTPADVRELHAAVSLGGPARPITLRTHRVLVPMLKAAMLEGHTVPHRVLLVKPPTPAPTDRQAIDEESLPKLLDYLAVHPDGARWLLALLQGIRQGEALGLRWRDIDLAAGTMDVAWQLQRLPYADRALGIFQIPDGYEYQPLVGAWHLVRPKTAAGIRVLPLVPETRAVLAAWREVAPPGQFDLVFDRGAEGWPRDDKQDRQQWRDIQAAVGVSHPAGRPYTIHEIRHTTATLLLERGVDPDVIRQIMGQSTIIAQRAYKHVSRALAAKALGDVAAGLGLPRQPMLLTPADQPAEQQG